MIHLRSWERAARSWAPWILALGVAVLAGGSAHAASFVVYDRQTGNLATYASGASTLYAGAAFVGYDGLLVHDDWCSR